MQKVTDIVDVANGVRFVRELKKDGYSIDMLAVAIGEAYRKHDSREKINKKERFLLGLRYAEFFAVENSDDAHVEACVKRKEFLNVLGISYEQINEACLRVCGLH